MQYGHLLAGDPLRIWYSGRSKAELHFRAGLNISGLRCLVGVDIADGLEAWELRSGTLE